MLIRRHGRDFSEKALHNGQAEILSVSQSWEERRGLREQSIQDIYNKIVGELLELIIAIEAGKPPEYALLELTDVLAYAIKFQGIFLAMEGRSIHQEVITTRPKLDILLSQSLLAAPVTAVPLKNSGSIDSVLHLFEFMTEVSGAITGTKVGKYHLKLAISKMITILSSEKNYHPSADGGRDLNKTAEKQIISLFQGCFEQPLNGHLNMPNAADVVPAALGVLHAAADSMYGYPGLDILAATFYYDDPRMQVAGKNARNYPVAELQQVVLEDGQVVYKLAAIKLSKEEIRAIRDQFPLSIIPPDYILGGSETPAQYLARKYPGMSMAQISLIVAKANVVPVLTPNSWPAIDQRIPVAA